MSKPSQGRFTDLFAAKALTGLFGKRKWPALPAPDGSSASFNSAILALNERAQVQSREIGDVLSSFVTVQDLITVGVIGANGKLLINELEKRVTDIEKRLADAGIP